MKQIISFTVNGEEREMTVEPNRSLLDALRTEAVLTGTKKGCDVGECGSCTVIMDGKPVNSCLVLSQEVRKAYDVVDRELRVVADIQRSLLPSVLPNIPTLELAAHYETSMRAGGDYYDFFSLPDGKWGILVADVSGHGLAAYLRTQDDFVPCFVYASLGAFVLDGAPQAADGVLFREAWVYDYGLLDELSICAYYVGQHRASLLAADTLLRQNKMPEGMAARVRDNRAFAAAALGVK